MPSLVNRERNVISVENNGKGIPVAVHAKEGVYVPELIFGHLLTSSNYDDNQKKVGFQPCWTNLSAHG
jgi:DNA topoisomerase II